MPCATVHLLTAGRALEAWREDPVRAPFDPHDKALVGDFLSGAMSPDMGFVAAVDRTVSELVHYVETGSVVQALLRHSSTAGERAFAWGWGTHHLTDVLIHPLVGRAVGEVLYGDPTKRVNASENEEIHVSVEVGLDIIIQDNYMKIPAPSGDILHRGRLGFVAEALADTYRLPVDPHRLAGDFRLAGRQMQAWPALIRTLGRAWRINEPGRSYGVAAAALAVVRTALPRESALRGLSRPQRPPDWLPEEVARIADEFPQRFQRDVESAGRGFENRNLETGELERDTVDHPRSEARLRWWLRTTGRQESPEGRGAPKRGMGSTEGPASLSLPSRTP